MSAKTAYKDNKDLFMTYKRIRDVRTISDFKELFDDLLSFGFLHHT